MIEDIKKFKNRDDAASQLIGVLPIKDMLQEEWLVLASSVGAVPIAKQVSKVLNAEFDYLFTHKVFTTKNNECEIAIITETNEIVIHEELMKSFSLNIDDIYKDIEENHQEELIKYKAKYRDSLDIMNLENKNVLLVDEGLNTGLTMMACIKSVISCNAKSICVAVPILPKVTVNDIGMIADDLYYVKAPAHFVSIDFYYESLESIDLDKIKELKEN